MNKTTKGALAVGAAAVLLVGGAGTLAYWSDDATIAGGDINAGKLVLSTPDCGDGWLLDGGALYDPETTLVVPGDSISQVCDLTLTATGDHIGATLDIDDTELATGPLADELDADATFTVDTEVYAPITAAGVYNIQATITVDFPYGTLSTPDPTTGADNDSQDVATALSAIAITAIQTHSS